ncbi:MAG: HNH endonuclease family protein, partial [Pseudomonadota bacterium]
AGFGAASLRAAAPCPRRPGAPPDLGYRRAHRAGRAAAGRLGDWLRLLARYAEAWRALKRHLAEPRGAMGTDVWRLGLFAWREWRPLALHYLERDAASPGARRWRARFEDLHRRCMAVTLYRFSAEARARMFLDALRLEMRAEPVRAFTLEGGRRRPLDFSIKVRRFILDGLRNPIEDVQVRRSVLIWRESELWVDRPAPPGYLRAATVEHVLPTKPALSARWAQDFPDAARRHALCHALGNMCLLDREVNAELSNRDYGEKLARLTAAGQHERYRLTADLPSRPEWTEEVVAARTARMAEEIWAALGLPHPDADAPAAPAEAAAGGPG